LDVEALVVAPELRHDGELTLDRLPPHSGEQGAHLLDLGELQLRIQQVVQELQRSNYEAIDLVWLQLACMSHQVFDCGVEHCAVVAQEVAECVDALFTQAGRAVKVVDQQLHFIKPKFSQLLCTRECFADDQVELGEPAANHGSVLKRLFELD